MSDFPRLYDPERTSYRAEKVPPPATTEPYILPVATSYHANNTQGDTSTAVPPPSLPPTPAVTAPETATSTVATEPPVSPPAVSESNGFKAQDYPADTAYRAEDFSAPPPPYDVLFRRPAWYSRLTGWLLTVLILLLPFGMLSLVLVRFDWFNRLVAWVMWAIGALQPPALMFSARHDEVSERDYDGV